MNWKKEAEQTLREHELKKSALHSIKEEYQSLCSEQSSLKSMSTDTPVHGGGNRQEEKMIGIIAKKAELTRLNYQVKHDVEITEMALNHRKISDTERKVLYRFFIDRIPHHVECLCEELNLEAAQIYRIKDEALRKFTLARYGKLET